MSEPPSAGTILGGLVHNLVGRHADTPVLAP